VNDPIEIAAAISIIALSIGGVTVLGIFARALLKKWTQPKHSLGQAEAQELRHAIEHLSAEVGDLHERLDFAERVLANQREAPHLGEGG
jgi:hypothetical protein